MRILLSKLWRPTPKFPVSRSIVLQCAVIRAMSTSNSPLDITATPRAGQNIAHEGKEYTTVKEGLAHILIPASAAKAPQTTPKGDNEVQSVFYNPIQQFNRDLSVLAIKAYGEEVVARKTKLAETIQQRFSAKRKEKKRKRQDNDVNGPRKAGKLDEDAARELPPIEPECEKIEAFQEGNIEVEAESSKPGGLDIDVQNGQQEQSVQANQVQGDQVITSELVIENEKSPPLQSEQTVSAKAVAEGVPISEALRPQSKPKPQPFTILDALSATGLRAVRYAHEVPFATSITANDLLPAATKTIRMNALHNGLEDKISAVTGNALAHMYSLVGENVRDEKNRSCSSKKYDVIDLDPYGTAAPFLDAAVQSVRDDGGLLCVTCTDAGVWASNGYPEKAYSLYGGIPAKGSHSHESGLRLILQAIATSAARYGLAMEPLLSLSIDYYARVFVRITKSAADVKFLAGKTMLVYNCDTGCGAWNTQTVGRNKLAANKKGNGYFWKHVFAAAPSTSERCEHCGMTTHLAGPMYGGPLHSPDFIKKILADLPNVSKDTYQTTARIEGMLTLALEELLPSPENPDSPTSPSRTGVPDPAELDLYPFFFLPGALSKVIHCMTPNENALKGALRHLGYRVTRSHTKPGSIKTDAPWSVIWDVMREWVKQKAPIKDGAIKEGTAGYKIMGLDKKENVVNVAGEDLLKNGNLEVSGEKPEIVFDERLGKERDAKRLVRYQTNPRENWGPMNRAKGKP